MPASRRASWRRRVAAFAAALAALAAACAQAPPEAEETPREPVEVRAAVDRAVATTGDLITYTIAVDHRAGLEVEIPEAGSEIAGFRIVDVGGDGPERRGDRVVVERWYRLRADLVGSYVLPPVTVAYRPAEAGDGPAGTVEASAIFVEVESVLAPGEEATDIRDIKPPRRSPRPWPWWALGAAAALAAAIAAYALWRRRRRRGGPRAAPEPADLVALRALEALRGVDPADHESVRRFHFRISEVVRVYVESRFGLNATDKTLEELRDALPRVAALASGARRRLERFLERTDRVKFAEHRPTEREIEGVWEDALSFVEATRPRPDSEAGAGETGEAAAGDAEPGERAA